MILGISAYFHDSAAVLLNRGEIVAAAEEERFTRLKHDSSFPSHAVRFCLQKEGIKLSDVSAVVFHEKPLLKWERQMRSLLETAPGSYGHFRRHFGATIKHSLFLKAQLIREFREIQPEHDVREKLHFVPHHQSHAASAFYPSPFTEAAILCVDSVGESQTTTIWRARRDGSLENVAEIHFPHSWGLFYSVFTSYCGFRVNSGEYKLMGLASYGKPRFSRLLKDHLVRIFEDGSLKLNMKYFSFSAGRRMHTRDLEKILGFKPRPPDAEISADHVDLAASVQDVLEEGLLALSRRARSLVASENLCLAGGVALNCKANQKIANSGDFKNIWIQPAAGDSGGALGCALAVDQFLNPRERRPRSSDSMRGALLGPEYSDSEIAAVLDSVGLAAKKHPDESAMIEDCAERISRGQVVGFFQGRAEFGPRALGSRSILADAREKGMRDHLNQKIKFREKFRPFAPVVLEEFFSDCFDGKANSYMSFASDIREPELFPAVTHVDHTSRVQAVTENQGPLHRLLKAFFKRTGCPMVINTSFNLRGEPIVLTPMDALKTFAASEIDALYLGLHLIDRKDLTPEIKKNVGDPRRGGD